jgi:hypothetical protein
MQSRATKLQGKTPRRTRLQTVSLSSCTRLVVAIAHGPHTSKSWTAFISSLFTVLLGVIRVTLQIFGFSFAAEATFRALLWVLPPPETLCQIEGARTDTQAAQLTVTRMESCHPSDILRSKLLRAQWLRAAL